MTQKVLRSTRRVCVTIQDCVMSTEKLKMNCSSSSFNATQRVQDKLSQPEAIFGRRNRTTARSLRASYIVFVV